MRDPYQPVMGEFLGEEFIESYAATGPRAMVIVPADRAALLEGLELPDEGFYDWEYRIERALHSHDRAGAQMCLDEMERADPTHRLTLTARLRLAWYDCSLPRQLAVVEELLLRHPKNGKFLWSKLVALRELARRADYREFLRKLAAERDSEVIFWREWAEELAEDAREGVNAQLLLLRALHFQPFDADNLRALASILWSRRDFEEATWLYRLSACLRDKVESFGRSYFMASRHLRRTDEALALLTTRFHGNAHQSAQPTRLLFWALAMLDRESEAFEKLEAALLLRPDDGELLLYAADAFARYGDSTRAAALLASAKPRTTRSAWLRVAANLADYRCDLRTSLGFWRELLVEESLAIDAHRSVTRLLAEIENRAAALSHLRETCARFPHHVQLHRLWVEWTRGEGFAEVTRVLRLLLDLDGTDAWAHRELALVLAGQRLFNEALSEVEAAAALEPNAPSTHATRGRILLRSGNFAAAQEACRDALRLSIDEPAPLDDLMEASRTLTAKRAALAFVREELTRRWFLEMGCSLIGKRRFPCSIPPSCLLRCARRSLRAPTSGTPGRRLSFNSLTWASTTRRLNSPGRARHVFPFSPACGWNSPKSTGHAARGQGRFHRCTAPSNSHPHGGVRAGCLRTRTSAWGSTSKREEFWSKQSQPRHSMHSTTAVSQTCSGIST